jgi:hypothetical protein
MESTFCLSLRHIPRLSYLIKYIAGGPHLPASGERRLFPAKRYTCWLGVNIYFLLLFRQSFLYPNPDGLECMTSKV